MSPRLAFASLFIAGLVAGSLAGCGSDAAAPGGSEDAGASTGADLGGTSSDGSAGGADIGGGGDPCGGCAPGFHCGPSKYCVSPTGVPAFDHVYVIVMENHSLSTLQGSNKAAYINGLAASWVLATKYSNVAHPSLPNYIALTSGSTQGIGCDCTPSGSGDCNVVTCSLITNFCSCAKSVEHLGDVLDGAKIPWREYGESMGAPCGLADNAGNHYAARHLPFTYYTNVQSDKARCTARIRDYSDFKADLAAGTYRFGVISPNLCNDMHDACGGDSIQNGDTWLSNEVPPILATPGFAPTAHDALFIVWDEQDNSLGDSPIMLIVASPLAKRGATTGTAYNHYNLLATIADGLGVKRLGMAQNAAPLTDIWR